MSRRTCQKRQGSISGSYLKKIFMSFRNQKDEMYSILIIKQRWFCFHFFYFSCHSLCRYLIKTVTGNILHRIINRYHIVTYTAHVGNLTILTSLTFLNGVLISILK